MSEKMYKYELSAPFQNKNAGYSRWTFGSSAGKEYFLKEFLNPVYPDETSLSLNLRQERIETCKEYEMEKKKLYEAVTRASDGNLVRVQEFFRYDSHYYISMEKVEAEEITPEILQKYSYEDRFLLCKTIAHSLMGLHREGIVHADIKANNILIKKTKRNRLTGKIIDCDSGFFESHPPKSEEELVADQVYMAPEACQFICGEEADLTCKIDVFALGILFHLYLAGELPQVDKTEYDYLFEAVLDGKKPKLSSSLNVYMKTLIAGMLECDPKKRFSMEKVYSVLQEMDPADHTEKAEETKTTAEKIPQTPKMDSFGFMQAGDL